MSGELVSLEQLRQWLDYKQQAHVIRWLDENGVRWTTGRDGQPVTTCTQINAALGMRDEGPSQDVQF